MGRQHDRFVGLIREGMPEGFTMIGMDVSRRVRIVRISDEKTVAVASFDERTWFILDDEGRPVTIGQEHDRWGGPYVEAPWMPRLARYLHRALDTHCRARDLRKVAS